MNVLSLGKQKSKMEKKFLHVSERGSEFINSDIRNLQEYCNNHFKEPRIIPPTTSYSHNREDHETDYDGIPLTWKENLTIAAICVLGAAVIIGVIYLIAR